MQVYFDQQSVDRSDIFCPSVSIGIPGPDGFQGPRGPPGESVRVEVR